MDVLIVDDSEASLRLAETLVAAAGHRVVGKARDGVEALAAYQRLKPDAVLMDVIMPHLNGGEAMQAMRAVDPQARVVLACSVRSNETALQAETLGARYFLFKPLNEETVRRVFTRLAAEADGPATDGSA